MKNSNTRYLTIGAAFVMVFLTAALAYAVTATPYNAANGKLGDDRVNDVLIYDTSGEQSSVALGFDANWTTGVAKRVGDPTDGAAGHVSLGGAQTDLRQTLRIRITAGGTTGAATFRTSLDGGASWSSTTYTTQSSAQDLEVDGVDSGLDVVFDGGAAWTQDDEFAIASWWTGCGPFPEKALIIATGVASPEEYVGSLDIIDLADDSVWMRFVSTPQETAPADQNLLAGPVHALAALNGKLYLGGKDGNMSGLTVIDLAQDTAWFYDYEGWTTEGWDWTSTLARRNHGQEDDGGWVESSYPTLTSPVVHDVDAGVVDGATYVAIATDDKLNLLKLEANEIYDNNATDCAGGIPVTALIGDDLYWAGADKNDPEERHLCARYTIAELAGSGTWSPIDTYHQGWPAGAGLISDTITALSGRDGMSPEVGAGGGNIVYVGTDAGLTILHETRDVQQKPAASYHYGYAGSPNDDLDYKVLAGTTDVVSDVTFVEGWTAVYVATNEGSSGRASVLRPYLDEGDTPYLIDSYASPDLPSNEVRALAHGSDLVAGTEAHGAARLGDVPTAVTLAHYSAASHRAPARLLTVILCLGIAALWFYQRKPSRQSATDASAGARQRDDDEDTLDPSL